MASVPLPGRITVSANTVTSEGPATAPANSKPRQPRAGDQAAAAVATAAMTTTSLASAPTAPRVAASHYRLWTVASQIAATNTHARGSTSAYSRRLGATDHVPRKSTIPASAVVV